MAIGEFGGAPPSGGPALLNGLYWLYEMGHAALHPSRALADATRLYFKNPLNPFAHTTFGKSVAAAAELFERSTRRYGKPDWGIDSILVGGERAPIHIATAWQRPLLRLDAGNLYDRYIGESEKRLRDALHQAERMAPVVVWIDEIEKGFASAASHSSDGGLSKRMFGTLLSWMNDRTGDVYLIATCNNISSLPPEFARAERFDGIVFLDLPGREEKQAIWELYLDMYEINRDQRLPQDELWTGAEIKSCCRLSALLDLPLVQAAQNVVPVAVTAAESVERLRTWASGRCLDAERSGIYRREPAGDAPRRRVKRGPVDPSNN